YHSESRVIEVNGCKSKQPVNMTYCTGNCGSTSVYSEKANSMMYKCECCQETEIANAQVELKCADGSSLQHTYSQPTACSCVPSICDEEKRRRR
uniref:CTCK domain-containing protein n=1 Tax=Neogobius melanostomus TaxID=47308 RepID=A0A8C6STW1_9GOBI